ncbi:hypothetical protein NHN12_09090 [Lactiplantibacillus plantarum]|uniref:hypothetical protein n=1 Tax=Lactiplantibacillus plantarum TaxID=1590 RepID=UPI00209E8E5A|nr:hypothetical protein [Lactiplantibacillus plantarum]USZ59630.1 hypothetical protein NHN12_09090 [Lactiplantibacillus plantarum]
MSIISVKCLVMFVYGLLVGMCLLHIYQLLATWWREREAKKLDIKPGDVELKKCKAKYLVMLNDGEYINKDYYDNSVTRGKGEYWKYTHISLSDAKRTQKEYGGKLYMVVENARIRPCRIVADNSTNADK